MAARSSGPTIACRGRPGAAFHPELDTRRAQLIIRKGYHVAIDSYSAFYENDRKTATGLAGYLRERGHRGGDAGRAGHGFLRRLFGAGRGGAGFRVRVVEDACRAIDLDESLRRMMAEMRATGVEIVRSDAVG